jgi:hypothetical protein
MVVPLAATGARVVSSKVIKGTTSFATNRNTKRQRKNALTTTSENIYNKQRDANNQKRRNGGRTGNAEKTKNRQRAYSAALQQMPQNTNTEFTLEANIKSEHSAISTAIKNYKRFKAAQASTVIFWTAIPFWVPQITFWMIGLVGLGGEAIPIANYLIPGETIFTVMHFLVMTIGIVTMMYAFMIYSSRMINSFSGFKGLLFCFCVAFYCAPLLNAFPWFVVWLIAVNYAQWEKD